MKPVKLKNIRELEIRELGILGEKLVDPFDFAQDRFLVVFLCFLAFFVENCRVFRNVDELMSGCGYPFVESCSADQD